MVPGACLGVASRSMAAVTRGVGRLPVRDCLGVASLSARLIAPEVLSAADADDACKSKTTFSPEQVDNQLGRVVVLVIVSAPPISSLMCDAPTLVMRWFQAFNVGWV